MKGKRRRKRETAPEWHFFQHVPCDLDFALKYLFSEDGDRWILPRWRVLPSWLEHTREHQNAILKTYIEFRFTFVRRLAKLEHYFSNVALNSNDLSWKSNMSSPRASVPRQNCLPYCDSILEIQLSVTLFFRPVSKAELSQSWMLSERKRTV